MIRTHVKREQRRKGYHSRTDNKKLPYVELTGDAAVQKQQSVKLNLGATTSPRKKVRKPTATEIAIQCVYSDTVAIHELMLGYRNDNNT